MKVLELPIFDDVRRMDMRQVIHQFLQFCMVISSALMIWKSLIVICNTEGPVVVVLSGSMEPAFCRGDILFLTNYTEDTIRAGDIAVFRIDHREIPIVHRVIKIHEQNNQKSKFLTKGDNNLVDDRGLYANGQFWLERKDLFGTPKGYLPFIGMITILMSEYPLLKHAILLILGFFLLIKRE